MRSRRMLRGAVLCALAAGLCGCDKALDKALELWKRIDPVTREEPAPTPKEENPAIPPPSMPPPPAVRSKSAPQGDRASDDRIMSLGMDGASPKAGSTGMRQAWEPDPSSIPMPAPWKKDEAPAKSGPSKKKARTPRRAR